MTNMTNDKIVIFNSLTNQKETFVPIKKNHVNMYVCGMTVYDYCHIGHARSMISFDMINRYLRYKGYIVKFVRNITDIDDKIINRANERGISISELTNEFIVAMHEDCKLLNILTPDFEPKATEYIDGMITMIQVLLAKKMAYIAENGDIYYRVRSFSEYGKLSNQNIDDLISGHRIQLTSEKEDPLDFVLWKKAKENEPFWESPFGNGRPGWHIECSVMSMENLGKTFDIHGGGMDLKFPHHECEIAQSEACNDMTMANYWMHNGFINIDNEKMSKSLNNFFTIRDVLKIYSGEVLRFFVLNCHYRSHINYSIETIEHAKNGLRRLYTAIKNSPDQIVPFDKKYSVMNDIANDLIQRFENAMNDDFNSALAISILFECANNFNKTNDPLFYSLLKELGKVLGLLEQDPQEFLQNQDHYQDQQKSISNVEIEKYISERNAARQDKDWVKSDRIRDLLTDHGIILEDSEKSTTWRRN